MPTVESTSGCIFRSARRRKLLANASDRGDALWLTVAGTPYVDGSVVGVKDARIVQIDNPSYRVLLEAALQGLVRTLRNDVGATVRTALAKEASRYRLTVNNLTITNLRARDNLLRATIDFELSGDAAQ